MLQEVETLETTQADTQADTSYLQPLHIVTNIVYISFTYRYCNYTVTIMKRHQILRGAERFLIHPSRIDSSQSLHF